MARLRRLTRRTVRVGSLPTRVYLRTAIGARPDDGLPTFVLIHGLGLSARYFEDLAELLSHHGSVVLLDLPGSGGLPRPRRAMSVPQFAAVVARILDRLDVRRPILIGHSMGAQIAVELMASDAERSEAALLIGPVVNASERRLLTVLRRFAESSVHERPWNAALAVRDYAVAGLRWPTLLVPAVLEYRIERRIAEVTGRLTLMAGEHDATAPLRWLERLACAATEADLQDLVIVPGAAHQVVVHHAGIVAEHAAALAVGRPR